MFKTVVLDGEEQVNISGSALVQVSAEAASGMAQELVLDGKGTVVLTEDAGAAIELVETGELGLITKIVSVPSDYTGPAKVAPSESRQVLPTGGKTIGMDIVIEPIPSNYGRIAWDGRVLTVY